MTIWHLTIGLPSSESTPAANTLDHLCSKKKKNSGCEIVNCDLNSIGSSNYKQMWKLNQSLFSGDEEQEDNFVDDSDGLFNLSPLQRMYGFAACLVTGLACMILSLIVFAKPIKFAVLFTFGNILAVGSTALLMGPVQQLRMMFDPVRLYASAIYIGCVVVALICALWIHSKILTVIAIICEIGALIWYSLSYIPFARRMVSELMIRLCDTEF